MKQIWLYLNFVIVLCTSSAYAQLDSIQQLPEVMLTDSKLIHFSKGYKLEKIGDSLIGRNPNSLTETLRYGSSIYFKENGFGMVSSPSFRGTNAAQTAVIWNGININSNFTGQTDFNTISPINYSEIAVRSGGGGVQFGSGAVGGSVHLIDRYTFKMTDTTKINVNYGSFSSVGASASTTHAWGNHFLNLGVNFVSSENDYEYVGKNRKNTHGQFVRFSAKMNEARKLKHGVATWNSEYTYNDRNFSGSLNTVGKDAYKDIATRNLWQVQQKHGFFRTTGSIAHLFEQYNYFPDSEKPYNTGGRANSFIGGIQTEVWLQEKLRINAKVEYTYVRAHGENVGDNSRKTLAAVLLMNHALSEKFNYGINIRQEFLNNFDNPFLFSADAKYTFSKNYILRLNGSKNYRIPTFNDLFWYAGGNLNLKPESSYQVELGQEISLGALRADLAAYYISSEDLIKWIPGSGGLWKPVNISATRNYGVEAVLAYYLKFNKSQAMNFNVNYSYTKAEDLEANKQLIYVPFNKLTGTVEYNFNNFSVYFQGLYNGDAFTTTDNTDSVTGYSVLNMGAEYTFVANPAITLGGRVKNIFDTYYENVAYRPMPSRNFQIFLNINI